MSYGSFTMSGTGPGLNLASMQTMTPLLHSTDANWPLISKLLANAQYKKMYIAHMRTINNENFISGQYKPAIVSMQTLIDNAVQTDANYLYTYANFQSNLTSTVTSGGPNGFVGIYQLMDTRTTYLNTSTEFSQVPPVITNVMPSTISPVFGSNLFITANVTNSTNVYLGYRSKRSDRFVRIQMLDDGTHGDGASGDNVFGASMPANSLEMQYYIYADNANAGMFSPERAEHEFYTLNPSIAMATNSDVVINEFIADNTNGATNESGKHKDWIEVYNKSNSALGLGNLFLSDSVSNLSKWKFPINSFIEANGFMVVWADDKDVEYLDYHCSFNLDKTGDQIVLSDSLLIANSVSFDNQIENIGLARCPDGTDAFQETTSLTPWASNVCELNSQEETFLFTNGISVYPNPASTELSITFDDALEPIKISVFNSIGQEIFQLQNMNQKLNISNFPPGLYILSVIDKLQSRQTIKFIKL